MGCGRETFQPRVILAGWSGLSQAALPGTYGSSMGYIIKSLAVGLRI